LGDELILASSSPRRKELLELVGIRFRCVKPQHGEESVEDDDVEAGVLRTARGKIESVAHICDSDLILGADTVVVCDGSVLGKPRNEEDAFIMLKKLSGKVHIVATGVTIAVGGDRIEFVEKTLVEFRELPDNLIREYVDTGLAMDKAGSYGIQDRGAVFVRRIEGDFYNVMGLPIGRVWETLHERGRL